MYYLTKIFVRDAYKITLIILHNNSKKKHHDLEENLKTEFTLIVIGINIILKNIRSRREP